MKIVRVADHTGVVRPMAFLHKTDSAIFVCPPDQYQAIVDGEREPPTCGYPLDDLVDEEGRA